MASVHKVLALYQELADCYERKGQAQMRDRFLVLAADAALSAGRPDQAEHLRLRLLQQNPHHLLKPYASLGEALKAPDVQHYVADLRRTYAPEAAEHLLESLRVSAAAAAPSPSRPGAPQAAAAPIRPTALHPPTQGPAKESPEVLQFYRVQQEVEEELPQPVAQRQAAAPPAGPKPLAPPAPPPPSRPPTAEAAPLPRAPAKKPIRPPAISPLVPQPVSPRATGTLTSEREQQDLATGYWVASALMVLLFFAGLALAVYTFARPFLPAEWFHQ
jgi:hypothetical protein